MRQYTKDPTQTLIQAVHCPNCGHLAEREYVKEQCLVRTQCACCDYLLVTSEDRNIVRVIESYAPGLTSAP